MEFLIVGGAIILGASIILLIPKWLRYTAVLNIRRQEQALNRRWSK